MGVKSFVRGALVGTLAIAVATVPSSAQIVTFSTSGAFSGGSCGLTSCGFGGFVLEWSPLSSASWLAPTDVDLGSFKVTCTTPPCVGDNILSGSTFMLTISQTGPEAGSGTFTGFLSGGLGWNPSSSSLFWSPTQGSVTIGSVTYGLVETDVGCPVTNTECINISAPNINNNPNFTDVKDDVTTTPEPATVALMATGMVGLVPVARRRRKR